MRRITLVLVSLAVVALVPATTASAYTVTIPDGSDVRGRLDIASVGAGHSGSDGVNHTITTEDRWRSNILRGGSSMMFGFDLDGRHRTFERCAFVIYDRQLRALLTSCGHKVIDTLRVSRPDDHSVTVRLSDASLKHTKVYRWGAFTRYEGAGCPSPCVDASPDRRPLYLHDLAPPSVDLGLPELVTDVSATAEIPADLTVRDNAGGSGIQSWHFQRRTYNPETLTWTGWIDSTSGQGSGTLTTSLDDAPEGYTSQYRVIAIDRQENQGTSRVRSVHVPLDDASLSYFGTWGTVAEPSAYQGSYHAAVSDADSVSFEVPAGFGTECIRAQWIGTGDGSWQGVVSYDFGSAEQVDAADVPDGQRRVLWQHDFCLHSTVEISPRVDGGSVPVDAISLIPLDA